MPGMPGAQIPKLIIPPFPSAQWAHTHTVEPLNDLDRARNDLDQQCPRADSPAGNQLAISHVNKEAVCASTGTSAISVYVRHRYRVYYFSCIRAGAHANARLMDARAHVRPSRCDAACRRHVCPLYHTSTQRTERVPRAESESEYMFIDIFLLSSCVHLCCEI